MYASMSTMGLFGLDPRAALPKNWRWLGSWFLVWFDSNKLACLRWLAFPGSFHANILVRRGRRNRSPNFWLARELAGLALAASKQPHFGCLVLGVQVRSGSMERMDGWGPEIINCLRKQHLTRNISCQANRTHTSINQSPYCLCMHAYKFQEQTD
jgi:hypothetical protein